MFNLVKEMHTKFGLNYDGPAKTLDRDEYTFRLKAFYEEINEYIEAYESNNIEEQFDALIDLTVFVFGAAEKAGFPLEEGFKRVMMANMQKEMVENASESKRGHKFDLKKPEGWRTPYLKDLIEPKRKHTGIIILEGPDGCGKTTLANHFIEKYDAYYMHSTWSPELEKRMDDYMFHSAELAKEISKNQLVILDRHWLSEVIYADVYRSGSIRSAMHEHMHSFFEGYKAKIIMCLPELNTILSNFDIVKNDSTRVEMYDDISDVAKAYISLYTGNESLYTFKNFTLYLDDIFAGASGLKYFNNFYRYDWTTDGKNMDNFIKTNNLI